MKKQEITYYQKSVFNKVEVDVPEGENPVVEDEQINNVEEVEQAQEMLEDPQIAGIFDDLRTEFPEPTNTPEPLNTGRLRIQNLLLVLE